MIKSIAGGQGVAVSNASSNWPFFQNHTNNSLAGSVRYDGNTQNFQVFDGAHWITISTMYPMIELTPDVHELLQWAKKKRDQEYKLNDLIRQYPLLRSSKDKLDLAKEQLDILLALVQNHSTTTETQS